MRYKYGNHDAGAWDKRESQCCCVEKKGFNITFNYGSNVYFMGDNLFKRGILDVKSEGIDREIGGEKTHKDEDTTHTEGESAHTEGERTHKVDSGMHKETKSTRTTDRKHAP